ncbi:MAG: ribonuclease H family protein [Saprospiraceae bacterium]|nr:ribonuclease H family protein [Saprospiraceae bacterium]MCB9318218.1 viroplasmin family protein [Lewinellaceae bacterium]
MAQKQKYYVVWEGVEPGIYSSWSACQEQIKGYPGAKYRAYNSEQEARAAFHSGWENPQSAAPKKVIRDAIPPDVKADSLAVDGACSGNPGATEYRGVHVGSGQLIFHQGPFAGGSNNLAEFLALVHALAYLQKQGKPTMPIYTDSITAIAWVRNRAIKSTITRTAKNKAIYDLVDRALQWIKTNQWKNPIIKWETEKWGEIPADFGRK